jgi:thiosulfate/3-mercaptopyruvate sulfurtransferase
MLRRKKRVLSTTSRLCTSQKRAVSVSLQTNNNGDPSMSSYELLISANALAENLENPRFRIIDCRFHLGQTEKGQDDYEIAHVDGACYANLDKDLSSPISVDSGRHPLPDIDTFISTLRQWGISNDSQVIVYDDAGGGVASRLWWMLRWLGHTDVALLDGGFAAWVRSDYKVSSDTLAPAMGSFDGRPVPGVVWTTADLMSWHSAGEPFVLVDARDGSRFRGEHEPIDPVAGHVPGAVSLPLTDNLNPDGTWRSPAEIKERWAKISGISPQNAWGVMCGSGVTACHLALSASIAGLPNPCLYVGSWSEWVRDPERPVGRSVPQ